MAKYTCDLTKEECKLVLNGLGVSLAQAQRAEKAARTDPVRLAFVAEGDAIKAAIAKLTAAFAV